MSRNLKSIGFAVILCIVCSILLTAASTGLHSYQQRNMAVDRHKNILSALGIITANQRVSAVEVEALYARSVRFVRVKTDEGVTEAARTDASQGLPLYIYAKNDRIQAYVIPIDTRGLWGKIYGYLAIENDGTTIRGFTVYQHAETPGLGGEIESRWFRENFQGKKITDPEGDFFSVRIAKGRVEEAVPPERRVNYVDGISGATMTGRLLTAGLKETLQAYEPVSRKFRNNETADLRIE